MPFGVRPSKFRHVFGKAPKPEGCYSDIKISKSPWESNMSAVNSKFLAVVLEGQGGGSFIVVCLDKFGRVGTDPPKVCGHKSPVLDIQWNPFDENEIASASEDCIIKLWTIPDGGITDKLETYKVELCGHAKKVQRLAWHPSAANILASSGADPVILIWNTEESEPLFTLRSFTDMIFSFSWNYNGSHIAATCKDKKLRVYDVRKEAVVQEVAAHAGTKPMHCVFLGPTNFIVTTGYSSNSDRQYKLWNAGDLADALAGENIDTNSGVLMPFWDEGNQMVYLVGKGDSIIRYFEVTDTKPYMFFLALHQSTGSVGHRGASILPRRCLDYMKCEVMRFYRIIQTKSVVEPLAMIVPRKSDIFQDDIYNPCASGIPALTADEWASGVDKDPMLLKFTKHGLEKLPEAECQKSVKLVPKVKSAPAAKKEPSVLKRISSPELCESARPLPVTLDEYRTAYKDLLQENEELKKQIEDLKG